MKRFIFSLLIVLCSIGAFAQDVIILTDGNSIEAKVLKVNNSEIEYKKWNNLDGPVYTLNVNMITTIRYMNGEEESYSLPQETSSDQKELLKYHKYNKVYLKDKLLTSQEIENILKTNCPTAYDNYMSGMKKREVASNLRVAGIGALAVSIVLYLNDDLYFLGYTFDVVGTGLFIASLPVGSVGKNQITDSYDIYNDAIKYKKSSVSVNFGTCKSGGIGFSLNF